MSTVWHVLDWVLPAISLTFSGWMIWDVVRKDQWPKGWKRKNGGIAISGIRGGGACTHAVSARCVCTGCAGLSCKQAPMPGLTHCTCGVCCADCLSPPNVTVLGGPPQTGGTNTVTFGSGGVGAGGGGAGGTGLNFAPGGAVSAGGGGAGGMVAPRRPVMGGAGSGMTGFAGAGHGNFDLALGSVHGIRTWWMGRPDIMREPNQAGRDWHPKPLRGVAGHEWTPGVNDSYCKNGKDHVPPVDFDEHGVSCGCGFWAYWDYSQPSTFGNSDSEIPVAGVVEGSGRVLIGTKGFRSQKARIIALALPFTIGIVDYTAQQNTTYGALRELSRPSRPALGGGGGGSYQDYTADYTADLEEAERARKKHEKELAEARQHADAWMAIIQDRIQQMYPDAQVFATVKGMLASVKLGEIMPK